MRSPPHTHTHTQIPLPGCVSMPRRQYFSLYSSLENGGGKEISSRAETNFFFLNQEMSKSEAKVTVGNLRKRYDFVEKHHGFKALGEVLPVHY